MNTENHSPTHEGALAHDEAGLHEPWRVAGVYALLASFWALLSDRAVAIFAPPGDVMQVMSVKHIVFVAVSSALLLLLLKSIGKRARRQADVASTLRREKSAMQTLLAHVVNTSTDALWARDTQGRYLFRNPAAERELAPAEGRPMGAEELPGAAGQAGDDGAIPPGPVVSTEQSVADGGEARTLETTVGPLHDEAGKLLGSYGISRDVTERRRTAARLALAATSFEQAGFGISIADARSNRLVDVNPAFARERGRDHADCIGMPIAEVFAPELLPSVLDVLATVRAEGHAVLESEHLRADGRRLPVLGDITLIRDEAGQPLYWIAYWKDLTRRRQVERELALSAKAFDMAMLPAVMVDARSDRILKVNQAFASQRGGEPAQFIGRDFLSLAPDSERERLRELLAEVDADDHSIFESVHLRGDGRSFPVQLDITATHDDSGAFLHRIAYVTDLSENYRNRALLAATERRYQKLFEQSPDAVLICEANRIVMANGAAGALVQVASPEALLGRSLTEFFPVTRSSRALHRFLQSAKAGESFRRKQDMLIRGNAEPVPVEISAALIQEEQTTLVQLILVDVRERRNLERELIEVGTAEQARIGREIHDGICQKLLAIDLMLGGLVGGRSHEGQHAKPTMSIEGIRGIVQQTLLEARALAQGNTVTHVDEDSLQGALQSMIASTVAPHGLRWELSVNCESRDLGPATASHIYRIAQESVANAVKHARATLLQVRFEAKGKAFSLLVRDDGQGMPDAAPAWGHLGLSIMQHRASIIGASLSFSPLPGGGTEVRCVRADDA